MSSKFTITFKGTATGNQIAAIEKELNSIGPGPVKQNLNNSFTATLDWGTSQQSLNNLKGRLNGKADIVLSVVAAKFKLAQSSTMWNRAFTDLVRQTSRAAWGNWALNPAIAPGAVGILDAATGSFTPIATAPGPRLVNLKFPEAWVVESSSVHQSESEVNFKGGYKDPSSGTEVDVGLDVAWTFAREGSIASNATVTGRSYVDDFPTFMTAHFDWFLERAKAAGYGNGDGIRQGFGMITHVQYCKGGVNIGSLNDDSTFSLTGSVDGVNAMTGGGEINASVKGSYKEVNKSAAFESHMWPSQSNEAAADDIGITFQFASFQGREVLPTWIQPVDSFRVVFDNAHGGTYIGHCSVDYSRPGTPGTVHLETTVSGGMSHVLDNIPLDAQGLVIGIDFVAGDHYHFPVGSPVTAWLTGQCTVDMSGVWPWGAKASIREGS